MDSCKDCQEDAFGIPFGMLLHETLKVIVFSSEHRRGCALVTQESDFTKVTLVVQVSLVSAL